jgi:NAD(P) transhydrogenase subunit alpha
MTGFELDPTATLLVGLTVFTLAVFVGFELISKVPPTLHTPLMSGSNAISGITIVGALFTARLATPDVANLLGMAAVALATINVVGGYAVTDRMMRMFGKNKRTE